MSYEESEVKHIYPDAEYMYFENSVPHHHIRLYGDEGGLPKSLGKSTSKEGAWKDAYNNLPNPIEKCPWCSKMLPRRHYCIDYL